MPRKQQHRSIGDLMRYAALNQSVDFVASYGGFIPMVDARGHRIEPDAPAKLFGPNYTDAQLYALGRSLSSLKPPANPNRFDNLAARGKQVFARENCGSCHT